MKTPRQLLFQRHQPAEPDLDAIRHRVVLDAFGPIRAEAADTEPATGAWPARLAQAIWLELVWPCRRAWVGLAAIWVVISVLNHASADNPAVTQTRAEPLSPAIVTLLKEQRQLAADLEDLTSSSEVEPTQSRSRPRSEVERLKHETV
ncbi:MAG: hypothetical protein KGS61_17800 [Verrucomicrobia bacterium]|nr:hypothetical protein [Verrucomicrobiota bacterium]